MATATKIPTPRRRLLFERNSFNNHPKNRHERYITEHYFNFSAEILVPGLHKSDLVTTLHKVSPSRDCYCIVECPVSKFIERDFIEAFIKRGEVLVLSHGTKVDTSNVIAILPSGTLVLSVDKDTYLDLGLPGTPSIYDNGYRYIVEVDISALWFMPGNKTYERVQWCLKDRLDLNFKFLITWTKTGSKTTSAEILSYFSECPKSKVQVTEEFTLNRDQRVPGIHWLRSEFSETEENPKFANVTEFFDWIGCVACGIDLSEASSDSYVSTMSCPQPSSSTPYISRCKWTGFITPRRVQELFSTARDLLKAHPNVPWVVVSVWGFEDSPTSFSTREHGFSCSGDNHYSFVLFPDDKYWLYVALGHNDTLP